jgi:hypothetical protein
MIFVEVVRNSHAILDGLVGICIVISWMENNQSVTQSLLKVA